MSRLSAPTFGDLLRIHRTIAGLTQADLAGRAGLSEQAVSTLERGTRRRPRRSTVQALTDALGLSADEATRLLAAAAGASPTVQGSPENVPAPPLPAEQNPVVPRQLPPTVPDFTGRAQALDDLVTLLRSSADQTSPAVTMIALTGMGGIGKTALAVHAGHLTADSFPDGQLYVNLRGYGPGSPLEAADALAQVLRSLGVSGESIPQGLDEAAALYRSRLAGKRVLLVLDNASSVHQVVPVLPGSAGSAVVVTSRRSLTGLPGFRHVGLTVLAENEAVDLLGKVAGRTRVLEDPSASQLLARLAGRLPLALRLVGARLAARPSWPLAHVVGQLQDEHRRLDEFGSDQSGVRASIAGSVEFLAGSRDELDRRSAAALNLLGLADGPDLTALSAARLLDASEQLAEAVLERLVDLHLVEPTTPGRYRLHDLIRSYARERAMQALSANERTAALARVLELYLGVAWESHRLTHEASRRLPLAELPSTPSQAFPDLATSLTWLDDERPNIIERIQQAADIPSLRGPLIPQLALALFGFLVTRTQWPDMRALTRLGTEVASEHGLLRQAAWLEHDRAIPDVEQGKFKSAHKHLESSLRMFRDLGDKDGEARCCTSLSHVLERLDRIPDAIEWAQRALALAEDSGDDSIQGTSHVALGVLYLRVDDRAKAESSFQMSFELARRTGNVRSLATRLQIAGESYLAAKSYEQATAILMRAYELYGDLNDLVGQASCQQALGGALIALGDKESGTRHLISGLRIARLYGDHFREGRILIDLGKEKLAAGDRAQAIQYWREAIDALQNFPNEEAVALELHAAATSVRMRSHR